ncbi:MAG: N-6 DNA methylase [Phycisphaerae bacterium]|nr:N-6 DNA methylase [Phycisphaerae bacterium]NUQ45062.1 N-6 DNA methylase [Phycisphaerae bacterium]
MPSKPASLDELIAKRAAEFADQVRAAAAIADKEEEIRIEVEKQLAFVQKEAGVKLQGKHEFTVASGRADSVYNCVIIEYKNPSSSGARIGPGANSPGAKKVVEQIKKRFYDMRPGKNLNTLFGVGCDGNHFVFVRFYNDKWQVQDPVEVNKHSVERFLWALFNLGESGRRFEPDYLAGDFGSAEGSVAATGIKVLYDAIRTTKDPKATTFFNQWKILFGEVCGYDVDNPSDKIKKLADFYGVPSKGVKPAEMLFAVHTYYALFMKLLAGEIIGHFHRLPSLLQKLVNAPSATALRRELGELEAGGIFRHLGITNFLEGDLFVWYLPAWSKEIEDLVRKMTARLDQYNPGTLAEEPAESRDMLKKLYQQLFPKSVRHDLGEYYTPDWLAEHVLNELGYAGDPDKRILDPACGSGTFLVMAITRIRAWYEKNREKLPYDEGELCRKILANVVGFDLNPLAVMAARTNYLIAIRDLVSHVDKVEIPVYLCDSILTPSTYGGLFAGSTDAAKELKTSAARFVVPTEIAKNREDVAKYAEQLEFCVRNGYEPNEFVQRCKDEGLPVTAQSLHLDLYKELVQLDKANKNGVWARIIKNAFAPLFAGVVDFIVGNPPWVNWESLPKTYRDSTLPIWDSYRLRERPAAGGRLGNVKKELSALFVYACLDYYGGGATRLGFVITQTVFKSGANDGFRRFQLGDGKAFRVDRVCDMSLTLPFEGAINRTAVVTATKGAKTEFPVDYRFWLPRTPRGGVPMETPLDEVLKGVEAQRWSAGPVEPSFVQSAWLTAPKPAFAPLKKVVSDRSERIMDRAYAGSCTWLNGVFWTEIVKAEKDHILVQNMGNVGRTKVDTHTGRVDAEFLYPLLRGRDLLEWKAEPSAFILVPHDPSDFGEPVSVARMKRERPRTFEFLKGFEAKLRSRSGYKQLHRSRDEFYVVGNVGDYALARFKVAFKDLSEVFQCAVVGPRPVPGGGKKPVVPDHTVLYLTAGTEEEAHFLAGLLNSGPGRAALYSASVGVQTQRYFPTDVSRVQLPDFDAKNRMHRRTVELSRKLHELAATDGWGGDEELEKKLSQTTSEIWGLNDTESEAVMDYYRELKQFRRRVRPDDDGEDGDAEE